MSTPTLEPRPRRRPWARVLRVGIIAAATTLVACLLGPFWFLAPIFAFTLVFSPRFGGTWKVRDEGEEEAREMRKLREFLKRAERS